MKRRIGLISEHASPLGSLGGADGGGQNVYVAQVACHLAEQGYLVDVFTRRDAPDQADVVEIGEGVRIVHVSAGPAEVLPKEQLLPFMGEFTEEVLAYHRRHDYDLFHANFFMSGLVAADMKQATGTPFVVTFHALGLVRRQHQQQADGFPDERFDIERRVMREADVIIAECPQDQEDQVQLYGSDPHKIRIIPCGFNPDELWPVEKSVARSTLKLPADEPIVLHVGRMVRRKGVDNVLHGFSHLLKRDINARLVVVGGESDEPDPIKTPELGRLQAIAAELGISEQVQFVGRRGRKELKYFYSAADVFVTTPWYEPFGITPLEAMACSAPVIGSNVGGIKYSVADGETGYLVPPNDGAALGEALERLLGNPALREQFSRNAIRRVNEHFTWKKVSDAIAALFEEMLAARQASRLVTTAPERKKHRRPVEPRKAVFLDKDGTILEDVPYNVEPRKMRFLPGAIAGMQRLAEAGYELVVISNQSGVAHGYFDEDQLIGVESKLRRMLHEHGIAMAGFFYCPHHPAGSVVKYSQACDCRKPRPGMILRAADELNLDLSGSWFIGDILNDIEAGRLAGCQTVLVDNGGETEWLPGPNREPHFLAADLDEAASLILNERPSFAAAPMTNTAMARSQHA